jgi:hypothetical protein
MPLTELPPAGRGAEGPGLLEDCPDILVLTGYILRSHVNWDG